ncbi:MAG: hypothetical protein ACI94L_000692 [Flavobacteriaceae bacterium]|jgi:hypothetical protein
MRIKSFTEARPRHKSILDQVVNDADYVNWQGQYKTSLKELID